MRHYLRQDPSAANPLARICEGAACKGCPYLGKLPDPGDKLFRVPLVFNIIRSKGGYQRSFFDVDAIQQGEKREHYNDQQ